MQQLRCFLMVLFGVLGGGGSVGLAQTLIITNGVTTLDAVTGTSVILSNRAELRLTTSGVPVSGGLVHLNSADSFVVLPNLKPSTVVASHLGSFRINGAIAVVDVNCRVVQYAMGAILVPHAPAFQPLQIFSGPHFTGASNNLSQYVYYTGPGLGVFNAQISSFKLKRGYMVTLAQNENGSGLSRNYVAQDGDLEISLLPAGFDDTVRFVYVTPWRWTSKKGIAGNIESGLNLQWKYNWNLDQNSTRDLEYVAIRQTRWWPGLGQNWQTRGVNTLLGYNEPDRPDQANLAVGDAIWSWPDLLATGLRLGAPAVSDGGRASWLYPFMTQAEAAGLRVDFVPVHYYWCFNPADPAGAANQFYNFLKATYDQVKRPLWITEWNNGANWTGCGDPTFAQQQQAIAAILDMLDNTPFVERYALYNWVEDVRRVKWDDGSLTSAGVTYRDKQSPLAYLQALPSTGTRSMAQLSFEGHGRDGSGYGNNSVVGGSAAYTNGVRGDALVFDGTNTIVTLPPNVATNTGFTFAAWINWAGGANWQRIFDFGNSTTHYLFLTPSSGSGTLRFAIRNGGSEQIVETSALPVNEWRHVALTLNGNTARLYVNGVQQAVNSSVSLTPASFAPRVNFLGDSQFTADPLFRGLMDEVLITDYALNSAQVAALQTNVPPQFSGTFFAFGAAIEGQAYSNSLAGLAEDADAGDTLTYSKTTGPAWLNVAANGTLTGTPTSSDGGTNFFTVRATDSAGQNAFALISIVTTVISANGTWTADANGLWSEPVRWSGNTVATGAGRTADFSTINITGNRTVTLDSSRSIGTLKFGDTSGAQTWTLTPADEEVHLTLDTASATQPAIVVTNIATLNVPVAGTNGFVKSGPGTLILGANNALSGTLNLDRGIDGDNNDGITRLAHPAAALNITAINIRNTSVSTAGGAILQLDGSADGIIINPNLSVTCRNNTTTPTIQNLAGTNIINGNVLLNVGGNSFNLRSDAGLLVFNGTNRYVGTLTGGRTYNFLGNGHHWLNGPILNSTNGAPIGLTKSGLGSLTLMATNTFTNTTTISGGMLQVHGAITASAVTIANSALLAGTGVLSGPVTVQPGGAIEPGAGIGKLTINNALTLQAGSTTRLKISRVPLTNDVLRVTGIFSRGGNLVITNVSGDLAPGDSFALFQGSAPVGAFASVTLPPLNYGLAWDTTGLNAGLLAVVATNPPTLTNWTWPAEGGFQLSGQGSASQTYTLEAATNLIAPIFWSPVTNTLSGLDGAFELTDPEALNHPHRFYRVTAP